VLNGRLELSFERRIARPPKLATHASFANAERRICVRPGWRPSGAGFGHLWKVRIALWEGRGCVGCRRPLSHHKVGTRHIWRFPKDAQPG
jgi:hypothetical protein